MSRAIPIAKIEGLSDDHADKLRKQGIENVDDLWSRVGADFSAGIKQVSEATAVPEQVITALLIAASLGKLNIKHGWLSYLQNFRIYLTVIVVALIVAALYLALESNLSQQVIVINPQGIAAYRVITKDDIALRRVPFRSAQTLSDPQSAVGAYALTKLEPHAPLRRNQILPAGTIAKGFIVSVPVKASSLVLAPKPGAKLALLPLPDQNKDKPPPTATIDAVLLGIEQREGGPTLVVVVDSIEKINALLSGATIVSVLP